MYLVKCKVLLCFNTLFLLRCWDVIGEWVCGGEASAQETRNQSFFIRSMLGWDWSKVLWENTSKMTGNFSNIQFHSQIGRESAFIFLGKFYRAESKNTKKRILFYFWYLGIVYKKINSTIHCIPENGSFCFILSYLWFPILRGKPM